MANKITLGKRPKTFTPVVMSFPLPEGGEGSIEVIYKYRTRSEFGKLLDETKADSKTVDDVEFSWEDLYSGTAETGADYLLKVLDSWNLDVEMTRANLIQLSDECPAAVAAIMKGYRDAVVDGHLGN